MPPGTDAAVETSGLTKRYGGSASGRRAGILAVDHLNLNIQRGEIYGFLGPNGAGKTTTLRMLMGLIRPTEGSAVVAGFRPGEAAGLRLIGALIESPAFYPYLSGRDNLRLLARYSGVDEAKVGPTLERVELTSRAGDKFSTYSLGMKQRLGVAGALLKDPELLILDEPSNGLDPHGMVEMRDLLRGLGSGGQTVLVSSHLLGEVEQVCNRVGVIRSGRLIAEGTIAEIRGGASGVTITAEPAEKAREVLALLVGEENVRQNHDGVLVVTTQGERAAELNRALVNAGVEVSGLSSAARSLEEVFLELTADKAPA